MEDEQEGRRESSLRLTHPSLEFWVNVDVQEKDGVWKAVAHLAGEEDVGVGASPRAAVRRSLASLGERLAREMAEGFD